MPTRPLEIGWFPAILRLLMVSSFNEPPSARTSRRMLSPAVESGREQTRRKLRWFGIMTLRIMLLAAGIWISTSAWADDPIGMAGWWMDDTGRAAILVRPCAEGLCGTIGWMKEPIDPKTGALKRDSHNPTPALRTAPLCGLRILWGFHEDGTGHWTDGRVYDPESGNTYSAEATLGEHDTLKLHGYIFVPLIGRTKLFMRPGQPLKSCLGD